MFYSVENVGNHLIFKGYTVVLKSQKITDVKTVCVQLDVSQAITKLGIDFRVRAIARAIEAAHGIKEQP